MWYSVSVHNTKFFILKSELNLKNSTPFELFAYKYLYSNNENFIVINKC
jgi:hypothetical protein